MTAEKKTQEGEARFAEGRVDEARACFEAALALAPSATIRNNLGVLAYQTGATAQAIAHFEAALVLSPTDVSAVFNLADVLVGLKRLGEAEPHLARLAVAYPDEPQVLELWTLAREAFNDAGDGAWRFGPGAFKPSANDRITALFTEGLKQMAANQQDLALVSFERLARMTDWGVSKVVEKLTEIHRARQDIPALMALYKRAAVSALNKGQVDDFLNLSYQSIYAEQLYSKAPRYLHAQIDFDFHAYIGLVAPQLPVAAWLRDKRRAPDYVARPKTLRVGFVLEGFSESQAPGRTYLPLAEHYDRDRLKLFFYSRWSHDHPNAVRGNFEGYCTKVKAWGCEVRHPPAAMGPYDQIAYLAERAAEDQLDVLVFQTTYFVPGYNLFAALRVAPFQVAIEHQQGEYHPAIDMVYTVRHTGMDARARRAIFPTMQTKVGPCRTKDRAQFGIPKDATLLVTTARGVRYAQPEFWSALQRFMDARPDVWYLAVGLDALGAMVPKDAPCRSRMLTPGYRTDVLELLAMADVYVNLFPSGGGSSVVEAMQQGLPVVCFAEDFRRHFKVAEASVAAAFVDDSDLVRPFGDVGGWLDVLGRLVGEPEWRAQKSADMLRRSAGYEPDVQTLQFFEELDRGIEAKYQVNWGSP